jgi:uncharacterized membrane-anchored protein
MKFPAPRSSKVPAVTFGFWVTKVLTTAMGEDASDFLVHRLGNVPAVATGLLVFVISLYLQFRTSAFNKWIYWFAVSMVSVFGTMAADILHIGLGIPYAISAIFFLALLILIFVIWNRVEGTLSIASITTTRREVFYWLTVLATFALGTAVGDMTGRTWGWGYLSSGLIFGLLFIAPLALQTPLRLNPVIAFWISYVLTRPFGASFADWFGAAKSLGGHGWGYGSPALVLTILILAMVSFSKGKEPANV